MALAVTPLLFETLNAACHSHSGGPRKTMEGEIHSCNVLPFMPSAQRVWEVGREMRHPFG